MNRLYNQCLTLFDFVLPRTDRQGMTAIEDELENELDIHSGVNSQHRRATVIGAIPSAAVKQTLHLLNGNQSLPRRHDDMSEDFKRALRGAYVQGYGDDEIYLITLAIVSRSSMPTSSRLQTGAPYPIPISTPRPQS
jgi:hypothetical protein